MSPPIQASSPLPLRSLLGKCTQGPWYAQQNEDCRPPMHSDWRVVRDGSTPDRIAPIARMELRGQEAQFNAELMSRLSPATMEVVLNALEAQVELSRGYDKTKYLTWEEAEIATAKLSQRALQALSPRQRKGSEFMRTKIDPLKPSPSLLIKLGSVIVHQEELASPTGHLFDKSALETVRNDPEVVAWLKTMTKQGLLPVKR